MSTLVVVCYHDPYFKAEEVHLKLRKLGTRGNGAVNTGTNHVAFRCSARPWDWQLLVNGSIDEHAYELGRSTRHCPLQNSSA